MVYWLTPQGAAYVAGLSGTPPAKFIYRREPKWLQLIHDLAVNDFRITLLSACSPVAGLVLEERIPQGVFWANPDRVAFAGQQARQTLHPSRRLCRHPPG